MSTQYIFSVTVGNAIAVGVPFAAECLPILGIPTPRGRPPALVPQGTALVPNQLPILTIPADSIQGGPSPVVAQAGSVGTIEDEVTRLSLGSSEPAIMIDLGHQFIRLEPFPARCLWATGRLVDQPIALPLAPPEHGLEFHGEIA